MSLKILLLILVSVSLSALAQLVLKLGMSEPKVQGGMAENDRFTVFQAVALNLKVLAGLTIYGLGAVLWLFVLARTDVSMASIRLSVWASRCTCFSRRCSITRRRWSRRSSARYGWR